MRCSEDLFITNIVNIVLSTLVFIFLSYTTLFPSTVAKRSQPGTLQGVPCHGGSASRPPGILNAGLGHWPSLCGRVPPGGEVRALVLPRRWTFLPSLLWFLGLFFYHRCCLNVFC